MDDTANTTETAQETTVIQDAELTAADAAKLFASAITNHIEAVVNAQNRGNKATLIQMAEKIFVDILVATGK